MEGLPRDRHLFLESQILDIGSTSALGFADNLEFHQLELRNLLNSGGALPKFFDGVPDDMIKVFLALTHKIQEIQ